MNFLQFAEAHGLQIDHLIEGRWARVKTMDKRHHRNGAYKFMGNIGWVQNHATMDGVAVWRPDGAVVADRTDMREQMRKSREALLVRQRAASELAQAMLSRASLSKHPYFALKGFPNELGLVLDDELLVPMREHSDYRRINGLQKIDAVGKKLFLPGSKAAGAVFKLGNDLARERWLCEGMATALSLRAALRDLRRSAQTIVCFSAGNILHVAPKIRKPAFVMADNDRNGVGAAAAVATGLPWVMPPDGDANDWHQLKGLRALVKVITSV